MSFLTVWFFWSPGYYFITRMESDSVSTTFFLSKHTLYTSTSFWIFNVMTFGSVFFKISLQLTNRSSNLPVCDLNHKKIIVVAFLIKYVLDFYMNFYNFTMQLKTLKNNFGEVSFCWIGFKMQCYYWRLIDSNTTLNYSYEFHLHLSGS